MDKKMFILIEIDNPFQLMLDGIDSEHIKYQIEHTLLNIIKNHDYDISVLEGQEAEAIQIGKNILSLVDERINNLKVRVERD